MAVLWVIKHLEKREKGGREEGEGREGKEQYKIPIITLL